MNPKRSLLDAPGHFYVEAECCLSCGVPFVTAPDLFGDSGSSCFVKRQPESSEEVDLMLLTMIRSEVGCIRYGGNDAEILRRLAAQGEGQLSDVAPPKHLSQIELDHVGLRQLRRNASAPELMDAFVTHLEATPPHSYIIEIVQRSERESIARLTWSENRSRLVTFQPSTAPGFDWLVVGAKFDLYDWLKAEDFCEAVFFEASDWREFRSRGSKTPW